MNNFNAAQTVKTLTKDQVHALINKLETDSRVQRRAGNVKAAALLAKQLGELTMALMEADSE